MRRMAAVQLAIVLSLAIPLAAPGAAAPGHQGTQQRFKAGVDVLLVDAVVVDAKGQPVGDLRPEEFAVTIDGKPRPILSTQFVAHTAVKPAGAAPARPGRPYSSNEGGSTGPGRVILIVFDAGNIRAGGGRAAAAAVGRLLDQMTPADRVGLASIPHGAVTVEFTTIHARIREVLGRLVGNVTPRTVGRNMSLNEAFAEVAGDTRTWEEAIRRECSAEVMPEVCRSEMEAEARVIVSEHQQRTVESTTAVRALAAGLGRIPGPKTMVLISEGWPVGTQLGFQSEFRTEASRIAEAAARSSVTIYTLRLDRSSAFYDVSERRAPIDMREDAEIMRSGIDTVAGYTRGTVFDVVGAAEPIFERLALELSGYYLLGLEPAESDRDGKSHKVGLSIARKNLTTRWRREFTIAPGASGAASDRPASPEQVVASMLGAPATIDAELPLRVTAFGLRDQKAAAIRLLIAADIGSDESAAREITVGFVFRDPEERAIGASVDRLKLDPVRIGGPLSYVGSATVRPGRYTLRFAVVDADGRRGSVEHPVDAKLTRADALEASDLVLVERGTAPIADGWRPSVETVVRKGSLSGYLELYAADRNVLRRAAVRLELAEVEDGPAIVSSAAKIEETKGAIRASANAALALTLVPPGEYVARAVLSLGAKAVGHIARPVTVEVGTAAATTAGAPRTFDSVAGTVVAAAAIEPFRREALLAPAVVGHFLDRAAKIVEAKSSPKTAKAIEEARAGRFDQAFSEAKGAPADDAQSALIRGMALLARNELEPARKELGAALRASPDLLPAIVYQGACYAAGGHDRDAAGAWQTSLLTESESPIIYQLLGDTLLRLDQGPQARDILLEALSSWPEDDGVRKRLAAAHVMAGEDKEALVTMDPYLERHPDDLKALFLAMGTIYAARREGRDIEGTEADRARAARYAEQYAARQGPESALVARWLRFLEERRPE